jgi:hypothetical protein
MSRLKLVRVSDATLPSEKLVQFRTEDGLEEVIVPATRAVDGYLDVFEVAKNGENVLVKLPRESVRGFWRIWVPARSLAGQG